MITGLVGLVLLVVLGLAGLALLPYTKPGAAIAWPVLKKVLIFAAVIVGFGFALPLIIEESGVWDHVWQMAGRVSAETWVLLICVAIAYLISVVIECYRDRS